MNHFLVLDDEGYFSVNDIRLTDTTEGAAIMESIRLESHRLTARWREHSVTIESFHSGLVALEVERADGLQWKAQFAYGFTQDFFLHTLRVDEWDRFHGMTSDGVPFVLSRAAQSEFFNSVDEFDDESVTVHGQKIQLHGIFLTDKTTISEPFWSDLYRRQDTP